MSDATSGQKIFGLGLSRTGTTSLATALELLGIRALHYPDDDVTHAELRGGRFRLSVLGSHEALLDTPVAAFYRQLDRAYPGSKFILTLRDEGSWLRSCESFWPTTPPPADGRDDFRAFIRMTVYGCVDFQRGRFAEVYEQHTRNVLDYFSDRPEQLLLMDIVAGDGWEILCPFLGHHPPRAPFPHANDRAKNEEWQRTRHQALEELASAVRDGTRCILVDEQSLGPIKVGGKSVLPFLEKNGRYWGRPSDDAEAIAELERLRDQGACHLVFAWPAFWWLEHYARFARYLRQRFPLVSETDRIMVFALRPGSTEPWPA